MTVTSAQVQTLLTDILGETATSTANATDLSEYLALSNNLGFATPATLAAQISLAPEAGIVQQVYRLYEAVLGRAPDAGGLQNWVATAEAGLTTAQIQAGVSSVSQATWNTIINGFTASAEFQAKYSGIGGSALVDLLYSNILGRSPDATGLATWTSILGNAVAGTGPTPAAVITVVNGIVNSAEFINDSLANNTAATVAAALADTGSGPTYTVTPVTPTGGTVYTLTTGIDNFVGGAGNDTFVATVTPTSAVIGGLDSIDGGAGVNTFSVADTNAGQGGIHDFTFAAGFTMKNIQTLNITTNGTFGSVAQFDLSSDTSLTTVNLVGADALGLGATLLANVKVADTTALNLTTNAADAVTVNGGTAIKVVNGTGADINGAAETSVTVTGNAGAINIANGSADATSYAAANGTGTTLTSVTLSGDTGAVNIKAEGLTTLNWAATALESVTITDAAAGAQSITANLTGVGFSAAGGAVVDSLLDNTATTINLVATGTNALTVGDTVGATFKTLTVGGTGSLALTENVVGTTFASLTSINLAANSGGVTLSDDATKAVLVGGSGNDVVTLNAALTTANGASINLGAGNNTLLAGTGSIGAGVSVDGGTGGTNTISASLLNAGNAATIKDFQVLDISGFGSGAGNGALDTSLLATAVSGVSITTAVPNGTAILQNLGTNVTITDNADSATLTGALTITHAGTATNNTIAISFGETSKTSVNVETLATLTSTGDATISIASGGKSTGVGFGNAVSSLIETDNHLTTVTVTGAKAFTLGAAHTDTAATLTTTVASSLTLIDGSGATGALTITAGGTDVVSGGKVSYAGLTIKGGTGGDTITNNASHGVIIEGATASTTHNTLTLGATASSGTITDTASAGADSITLSGANDSAALGSGTGVTVAVSANAAASDIVTVTLGTGTATVTDALLYGSAAGTNTASTTYDLLSLGGTLHGNTLAFSAAIATAPGALGAATSVASAQTFDQAVFIALGGSAGTTTTHAINTVDWFQYAGNTYIVDAGTSAPGAGIAADAEVVKIAGTVDLSHAVINAAGAGITFA